MDCCLTIKIHRKAWSISFYLLNGLRSNIKDIIIWSITINNLVSAYPPFSIFIVIFQLLKLCQPPLACIFFIHYRIFIKIWYDPSMRNIIFCQPIRKWNCSVFNLFFATLTQFIHYFLFAIMIFARVQMNCCPDAVWGMIFLLLNTFWMVQR